MSASKKDWLDTSHLEGHVAGKSVVGMALQFLRGGAVLLSAIILSRLLDPAHFGVVATMMPLVALAQLLKDFGINVAVVQKEDLGEAEVKTFFWLQAGIGLVLAIALGLVGIAWAAFYGDDRMIPLAWAMAGILFIGVLGNIHHALLRRNLLYGKITILELVAVGAGLAAAVIGALSGAGYWALVIQQFVTTTVTLVALWYLCSWRPGRPSFHRDAAEDLAFGGTLTIGQVFDYLRCNVDIILIRKFTDEVQLGYYGRANRIMLMPVVQVMGPVMAVALPMLSRKQDSPDYNDYFENVFRFCVAVAVPVGVFGFLFPEAVVRVLLGGNWDGAIPIVKALGIVAIFHPIGNCLSVNLVVFRKLKIMLVMPLITAGLSVLAYFLGIQESVPKLAEYYAIVVALMIPIYCWLVVKNTPVSGVRLLRVGYPLFLCMALAVVAVKLVVLAVDLPEGYPLYFFQAGVFFVVYAFVMLFFAGYWQRLKLLIDVVRPGGNPD